MNEVENKIVYAVFKNFSEFSDLRRFFEPPQIREPEDHAPTHARTRTHAFDGKWVT